MSRREPPPDNSGPNTERPIRHLATPLKSRRSSRLGDREARRKTLHEVSNSKTKTGRRGSSRRRTGVAIAAATVLMVVTPAAFAADEVSVSPTGPASGSVLAVSGTSSAQSSGGVAVSGTGYASGGAAGLTGVGDASGPVSVDASRTAGTAWGALWQVLRDTDVFHNTGINPEETAYQVWAIATSPPPDPNSAVAKERKRLENTQAMVEETIRTPPPVPEQSTPHRAPTAAESAPISGMGQPNGWTCVPASARALYAHRGIPTFSQLVRDMGTDEAQGTTLPTAEAVIRRYYVGPSQPKLDRVSDRIGLMSKAVTAITNYDQGFMVGVATSHLKWWDRGDGTPRAGWHVLSGYAYVPMRGLAPGRAWVYVHDSRRSSGGWGSGSHGILSDDLAMAAMDAVGPAEPNIIW